MARLQWLAREWAQQLEAMAPEQGWDADMTRAVIHAQTTAKRLYYRVMGPCHYCGTWLASSLDHIIPRSLGGSDYPENLVSCCMTCNKSKGNRTLDEWTDRPAPGERPMFRNSGWRDERLEYRRTRVVIMRRSGMSFGEIGARLGVSGTMAKKVYERGLKDRRGHLQSASARLRELASATL